MTLVESAEAFARQAHARQVRKFGPPEPYASHLARVAATVERVGGTHEMIAAAWLHDTVEDQGVTIDELQERFGHRVAEMVLALTNVGHEFGNRGRRHAINTARLAAADGQVHTIKLADLIDNTATIVAHDPRFAEVYLREKIDLLVVLNKGDKELSKIARHQVCTARQALAA